MLFCCVPTVPCTKNKIFLVVRDTNWKSYEEEIVNYTREGKVMCKIYKIIQKLSDLHDIPV